MSYNLDRESIEFYIDVEKYMNQLVWHEDGKLNPKSQVMKWKIDEKVYVPNQIRGEEIDEELSLRGSVAMKQGGILLNLSLVLRHPSSNIERADLNQKHRNPDNTLVQKGHKHLISQVSQDDHAFVPDDVDWTKKPDQIIQDILREWNIKLRAHIKKPSSYSNIHQFLLTDYFTNEVEIE